MHRMTSHLLSPQQGERMAFSKIIRGNRQKIRFEQANLATRAHFRAVVLSVLSVLWYRFRLAQNYNLGPYFIAKMILNKIIWASAWYFQQCGMCDQQSLRSACAYAQSDQRLCLSLEYSMIVKLLIEHALEFLSLKGDCRGSFESTHVKMPPYWKSPALSHFPFYRKGILPVHMNSSSSFNKLLAYQFNYQHKPQ